MNIDFIVYTPPKVNYDLISLWGEVIYIPKKHKLQQNKPQMLELFNCYRARKEGDINLSVEAARLQIYGIPLEDILQTQSVTTKPDLQLTAEYIPCLYLNSLVKSKFLIIYFHSSGQDIKQARGLLDHLRHIYQTNVLSMEYPGYSVYKGSANSQKIREDAETVYDYMTRVVGFLPQNIIVIGRSIGASTAIDLATKRIMGALVLISPFASLKSVAKELLGNWATFMIKQEHNNIQKIDNVLYPLFMLHGKADKFISYQNSVMLAKKYKGEMKLKFPAQMTHSSFDYYQDLSEPLRQFLFSKGINFHSQESNGPQIPANLFKNPLQMYNSKYVK